jgi:hypothetical protein
MKIRWLTFASHSGFLAAGGPAIEGPVDPSVHVDRAVFLAGKLEAGAWGTVQSYDGAGMSGGLLHNIAVGADDVQSSFFPLLRECALAAPEACAEVSATLRDAGWTLSADGRLRSLASGALAGGREIRRELSGSEIGAVPKTGPDTDRARAWADRLFRAFAHERTRAAQAAYAAAWMAQGNSADERAVYSAVLGRAVDSMLALPAAALPVEVELAMSVYHAFSVNAPARARKVLSPLLAKLHDGLAPELFAQRLVRALGTQKFARWQDTTGTGRNRYDRTRVVVWNNPTLWPKSVAQKLMPIDL